MAVDSNWSLIQISRFFKMTVKIQIVRYFKMVVIYRDRETSLND